MVKQKIQIFSAVGLFALTAALLPEHALAQSLTGGSQVGGSLFDDIVTLATGNLGVVIGLIVSLIGLYSWLISQKTWGLVMVIGGATATAFPGIYASVSTNIKTAFSETFGDTTVRGDRPNIQGGS